MHLAGAQMPMSDATLTLLPAYLRNHALCNGLVKRSLHASKSNVSPQPVHQAMLLLLPQLLLLLLLLSLLYVTTHMRSLPMTIWPCAHSLMTRGASLPPAWMALRESTHSSWRSSPKASASSSTALNFMKERTLSSWVKKFVVVNLNLCMHQAACRA